MAYAPSDADHTCWGFGQPLPSLHQLVQRASANHSTHRHSPDHETGDQQDSYITHLESSHAFFSNACIDAMAAALGLSSMTHSLAGSIQSAPPPVPQDCSRNIPGHDAVAASSSLGTSVAVQHRVTGEGEAAEGKAGHSQPGTTQAAAAAATAASEPVAAAAAAAKEAIWHQIDAAWAAEAVRRGVAHAKAGEYQHAMDCYAKALELHPSSCDALVARGAAYANQGQLRPAVADFEAALRLEPGNANAAKYLQATRRHMESAAAAAAEADIDHQDRPQHQQQEWREPRQQQQQQQQPRQRERSPGRQQQQQQQQQPALGQRLSHRHGSRSPGSSSPRREGRFNRQSSRERRSMHNSSLSRSPSSHRERQHSSRSRSPHRGSGRKHSSRNASPDRTAGRLHSRGRRSRSRQRAAAAAAGPARCSSPGRERGHDKVLRRGPSPQNSSGSLSSSRSRSGGRSSRKHKRRRSRSSSSSSSSDCGSSSDTSSEPGGGDGKQLTLSDIKAAINTVRSAKKPRKHSRASSSHKKHSKRHGKQKRKKGKRRR